MSHYNKFLDDRCRLMQAIVEERRISVHESYRVAEIELLMQWIHKGKAREAVYYVIECYDAGGGDHVISPLSDYFTKKADSKGLKKIWTGVIASRHKRYYNYLAISQKLPQGHSAYEGTQEVLREMKSELLSALGQYESALAQLGEIDERIAEIRVLVESGRQPKPKPTTDKRKVDETVFWDLIAESRKDTESTLEAVSLLREKLEALSTTEIKKFQKFLLQKLAEAAHWDLWALAYIARRGCGDDAFEYFRAWLVMQGKEDYELALQDVITFARQKDWSDDPQCEEALYVAQEAYENKKFEPMPSVARPAERMKGIEWIESDLPKRYPDLVKIF